jgi:hypothetical protein
MFPLSSQMVVQTKKFNGEEGQELHHKIIDEVDVHASKPITDRPSPIESELGESNNCHRSKTMP